MQKCEIFKVSNKPVKMSISNIIFNFFAKTSNLRLKAFNLQTCLFWLSKQKYPKMFLIKNVSQVD